MRFLADESCDFAVVRALRETGHDVLAVAEFARGAKDVVVVRLAREERRILLTEDKDFGRLVYAGRTGGTGVVLLRFPAPARRQVPAAVLELAARLGERLLISFVVLEPGRARIGSMPPWPRALVQPEHDTPPSIACRRAVQGSETVRIGRTSSLSRRPTRGRVLETRAPSVWFSSPTMRTGHSRRPARLNRTDWPGPP